MSDDEKIFEMLRNAGEKIVELEKKVDGLFDCDVSNKDYDTMLYERIEKTEKNCDTNYQILKKCMGGNALNIDDALTRIEKLEKEVAKK